MTETTLSLSDGAALRLRSWEPATGAPRAVILALHGFNDHSGAFDEAGAWLAARGVSLFAYDQRGFGGSPGRGLWPGTPALVRDAREALAILAGRYPGHPLYLMGESMGGAVALLALLGGAGVVEGGEDAHPEAALEPRWDTPWETVWESAWQQDWGWWGPSAGPAEAAADPSEAGSPLGPPTAAAARGRVAGLVLLAPAVWARPTMPWVYRAALWLTTQVAPGLRLGGGGLDIFPTDNLPVLRALSEDPYWVHEPRADALSGVSDLMDLAYARATGDGAVVAALPPTLMLYGLNDAIIPAPPSRAVARHLVTEAGARFAVYPEGWHMLLRDRQGSRVLADLLAWTLDREAPLPSGAEANGPPFLEGDLLSTGERGESLDPRPLWREILSDTAVR